MAKRVFKASLAVPKSIILLMILTTELLQVSIAAGGRFPFAPRYRIARDANTREATNSDVEGSAYGYAWIKFRGGVKLQCETMVAHHLLNENEMDVTKHGFPDIQSKIIPPAIKEGENFEVWYQGRLQTVTTDSRILMISKFGDRTIWGAVQAFHFDGELAAGSPIFKDGKLVSIVTKSDGHGKHAISGISEISGHFQSHRVRTRTMASNESVYGGLIGGYPAIKAEVMRTKSNAEGPESYEIVLGVGTLRIVGWKGDNVETFHTRIGAGPDLTCGTC